MAAFPLELHHSPFYFDTYNSLIATIDMTPTHDGQLFGSLAPQQPLSFPYSSPSHPAAPHHSDGHDHVITHIQQDGELMKDHNCQDIKKSGRKQKKCNHSAKKKAKVDPATGYVHVRARRGEATDSHSLAERARREKINERMKKLQGLVPGCDKAPGKAVMLDEIINYIQSLQRQVEFLSMKLASTHPMHDEIGLTLEEYIFQDQEYICTNKMGPEDMSPVALVQSSHQNSHIQHTTFAVAENNYPMLDPSLPFIQYGQDYTSDFSQIEAMETRMPCEGYLDHIDFNMRQCFI